MGRGRGKGLEGTGGGREESKAYGDKESEPQAGAIIAVNLNLEAAGGSACHHSVVDVNPAGCLRRDGVVGQSIQVKVLASAA